MVMTHQGPMAERKPCKCSARISWKEKSYRNHNPKKKDSMVATTSPAIISSTLPRTARLKNWGLFMSIPVHLLNLCKKYPFSA